MNLRRAGALAVPSLAAGVGLALSLPPWGWWPLAFPAAGLLYWRLHGLRPRPRLAAGWLAGLGCFVPGLWWAQAFGGHGLAPTAVTGELLAAAISQGDGAWREFSRYGLDSALRPWGLLAAQARYTWLQWRDARKERRERD